MQSQQPPKRVIDETREKQVAAERRAVIDFVMNLYRNPKYHIALKDIKPDFDKAVRAIADDNTSTNAIGLTKHLYPLMRTIVIMMDDKTKKENSLTYENIAGEIDQYIDNQFYKYYGLNTGPDPKRKKEDINPQHLYNKLGAGEGLAGIVEENLLLDPQFRIVYVTGSGPNVYGHALIFLGRAGFIHIDEVTGYPKHMTINQFNDYLTYYGKKILGIQKPPLDNINKSILKFMEMLHQKYEWYVVVHNCLTFCHQILEPGGFDPNRADEYRQLWLSLPTNYLERTRKEQLFLRPDFDEALRPPFNENDIYTQNIATMKVLENYNPKDILRFVEYVLENAENVLLGQRVVLSLEADKKGTVKSAERLLNEAEENIKNKLLAIGAGVKGEYSPLFTPEMQKKMQDQMDIVEVQLAKTKTRLGHHPMEGHVNSEMRMFASGAEKAPSMNITLGDNEQPLQKNSSSFSKKP